MDIESQVQGNDKTVHLTADVVVVGSGAGGGVVAAELAKAGLKVIVIEKSKHRRFEDYSNNEMDSLFNNMEGNGLLQSDDAAISILAGSAFGGGTAINWACSLRTPDKVREEWSANTIYHTLHHKRLLTLLTLSITTKRCRKRPSMRFCNMGCPYAEKQGTHVTWLKDAAECGTQFIQQCKVEKVTYEKGKVTGIVGTMFMSGVKLVIQAATVVSSCGSMNSPLLLARSGLKNQHIGRNLKLHPVSFVQGYFPDRAVNPFEGGIMTSISDIVTDREGTGYGARIEVPSMHPGVFAAIGPYRGAAAFKKMMLQYKNRVSLMALCRDYDSTARVYQDAQGYTHIDFSLGSFDSVSLEKAIVAKMKILLAAGATEVDAGLPGLEPLVFSEDEVSQGNTVNSAKAQQYYKRIHEIGVVGQKAKLGSAHQMGTCRMGHNPSAGVVSPHGETWEVKGLYVADASVFPTPSGVNPMVTVLAVAHSIAQFIKSDLGVSSKL
ncbi:FAD/NAD(P)-binding domain-containing protein [Rhizoclosmatium globosum]|uniref:FAD/NAD(P)-binding domain-containing protein n=1 Tax=Rhizoclosmatium globosum TaxID=329046 RepID=A0A1Y2B498_9FUNG|nr:FAD/NAD(P)-binding domain-containing protein [Rhizoclosmatium globosum]|eukprot:ORY28905.1 FAD/NAD(P)-binding domain-containing protein [Rhizoclosmatium globosum]